MNQKKEKDSKAAPKPQVNTVAVNNYNPIKYEAEPVLFYFCNDNNIDITNLKFFDTEIDINLQKEILQQNESILDYEVPNKETKPIGFNQAAKFKS